ncbi:MAG: hypothetical protein LBI42_00915 [Chitinispirillales bacterium]|jgi:hypothetical protein|nr:hypothetical protein [Chitinispirillales bacterium]
MKKLFLISVCVCALAFASGCVVFSHVLGGPSTNIDLSYVKYPDKKFCHFDSIMNIAVLSFKSFREVTSDSVSNWDYIGPERSDLPLAQITNDLKAKLKRRKEFNVFGHGITPEKRPSVHMVIFGVITYFNISSDAYFSTFNIDNGKVWREYEAKQRGLLSINYYFVNSENWEILHIEELNKGLIRTTEGHKSKEEALSSVKGKDKMRDALISQINSDLITAFLPVDVKASYALATIRDNRLFKKSVTAAKKGDWKTAVEIWERFEDENPEEAYYNKMLYKRYIRQDLDGAIEYLSTAYNKTGNTVFLKWSTKFKTEKELEDKYRNSLPER